MNISIKISLLFDLFTIISNIFVINNDCFVFKYFKQTIELIFYQIFKQKNIYFIKARIKSGLYYYIDNKMDALGIT